MLTHTAGVELAPYNINVVGVGPGAVDTPINKETVADPAKLKVLDAAIPIGRCTIDQWQDDQGGTQWAARVLMDRAHGSTSGQLVGRTREGLFLSGPATFATDQEGPRGAKTMLVELHGTGPLVRTTDPAAASTK